MAGKSVSPASVRSRSFVEPASNACFWQRSHYLQTALPGSPSSAPAQSWRHWHQRENRNVSNVRRDPGRPNPLGGADDNSLLKPVSADPDRLSPRADPARPAAGGRLLGVRRARHVLAGQGGAALPDPTSPPRPHYPRGLVSRPQPPVAGH
jgi:hypothetical protein